MIYLLEDDDSIRELVVYTFNNVGLKAKGFALPSEFWREVSMELPELVMLDIMLPEEDGITVLKKIRASQMMKKIPVIMLTARGSEYDKVIGLDSGADDYIPKPFGMMELMARVRALLRRTEPESDVSEYNLGDLYVCPEKHLVKVNGSPVTLTLKEFEILCLLLKRNSVVMTREQLLDQIWGYSYDGESRTVDVHIRTLRQKLGDAGNHIVTVRGIGYKIEGKNEK